MMMFLDDNCDDDDDDDDSDDDDDDDDYGESPGEEKMFICCVRSQLLTSVCVMEREISSDLSTVTWQQDTRIPASIHKYRRVSLDEHKHWSETGSLLDINIGYFIFYYIFN